MVLLYTCYSRGFSYGSLTSRSADPEFFSSVSECFAEQKEQKEQDVGQRYGTMPARIRTIPHREYDSIFTELL